MKKEANSFKYIYIAKDVSEQERKLNGDISEIQLRLDSKREVDRYIHKYKSDTPSNIEKVLKIVNIELLPEDLQAAFKQAGNGNDSSKIISNKFSDPGIDYTENITLEDEEPSRNK